MSECVAVECGCEICRLRGEVVDAALHLATAARPPDPTPEHARLRAALRALLRAMQDDLARRQRSPST